MSRNDFIDNWVILLIVLDALEIVDEWSWLRPQHVRLNATLGYIVSLHAYNKATDPKCVTMVWSEYRRVGIGFDVNVTVLTWVSNSGGMLHCVKPAMTHEQDLLFDKLGVRTDGGHISDVKHFPACKYSLDKKWQNKFTISKMAFLWYFDPTKMINHAGKSCILCSQTGLLGTSLTAGGQFRLQVGLQISAAKRKELF